MYPDHSPSSGLGAMRVESTLLAPLAGRERAMSRFPGLLDDPKAEGLLRTIADPVSASARGHEFGDFCYLARTLRFDALIADFLAAHPHGVIVEMGAGLDTTFWRVAPEKARWFTVDLPDVTSLRRRLLPTHPRLRSLSADLTSPGWTREIDAEGAPVLAIACGVLHYIERDQVARLMRELRQAFPGVEVAFDASSKTALKRSQKMLTEAGMRTEMTYWVNTPAVETQIWDADAQLLEARSLFSGIALPRELGWKSKALVGLGTLMNSARIIRVRLGEAG